MKLVKEEKNELVHIPKIKKYLEKNICIVHSIY